MSGPSSEEKCEPNLTALLDIVLQLVMFFMLITHFATEQLNESIKLPSAIAVRSIDRTVENYYILNIDAKGITTIGVGEKFEVLDNRTQVAQSMKSKNDRDKELWQKANPTKVWENVKEGRSLIILRASKDCSYKQVHDVMSACRQAGYADIQLRVKVADDQ